jgi:hypothetical protein
MRSLAVFCFVVFIAGSISAQTTGSLSVSVSTASTGGTYAPKNVFAIWIEDGSGNFIKTLTAYADRRIQYLYKWSASTSAKSTQYNVVDAVTGATLSSHGTRTGTWNGTDYNKNQVPDGTYYVCFELTDKHAQGNYSRFAFTKGAANTITPANTTGFSNLSIQWTVSGTTAVQKINNSGDFTVFPNPSNGIFTITGNGIESVEVLTLSGKVLIKNGRNSSMDLSNYPDGIYLVRVKQNNHTIIKKLVKKSTK